MSVNGSVYTWIALLKSVLQTQYAIMYMANIGAKLFDSSSSSSSI